MSPGHLGHFELVSRVDSSDGLFKYILVLQTPDAQDILNLLTPNAHRY